MVHAYLAPTFHGWREFLTRFPLFKRRGSRGPGVPRPNAVQLRNTVNRSRGC